MLSRILEIDSTEFKRWKSLYFQEPAFDGLASLHTYPSIRKCFIYEGFIMTGEWRVPPKIYLTNIGYREHRQKKITINNPHV